MIASSARLYPRQPTLCFWPDHVRKNATLADSYIKFATESFNAATGQHLNCSCCRTFIHKAAGLRTIGADGKVQSALWDIDAVPGLREELSDNVIKFFEKMNAMASALRTRVPVKDETVFGIDEEGGWKHFCISVTQSNTLPEPKLGLGRTKAWTEILQQVRRVLDDPAYTIDAFTALTGILHTSKYGKGYDDKFGFSWWRDLITLNGEKKLTTEMLWHKISVAPSPAIFDLRNGSLGVGFKRLHEKTPHHAIKKEFDDILQPLRKMRATTEASTGNIEQAAKFIEENGYLSAFERSLIEADSIHGLDDIWKAPVTEEAEAEPEVAAAGSSAKARLDAMLNRKASASSPAKKAQASANTESNWETAAKNSVDVNFEEFLADLEKYQFTRMRVAKTRSGGRMPYGLMINTVATHADSKPIHVWDTEEERNTRCLLFPVQKTWDGTVVQRSWEEYFPNAEDQRSMFAEVGSIGHALGLLPGSQGLQAAERVGIKSRYLIALKGINIDFFIKAANGIGLFSQVLIRDLMGDAGARRVIENMSATSKFDNAVEGKEYLVGLSIDAGTNSNSYHLVAEDAHGVLRSYHIRGCK